MKKAIFVAIIIILFIGCAPIGKELYKVEATRLQMGTQVTITAYDNNQEKAENAVKDAFNEIDRIEKLLSNYKNDSEVSVLNNEGHISNISDDFLSVLNSSFYYSNISDGLFDISVQPILDLFSRSFKELNRTPTQEEISETRKKIGYEKIKLQGREVALRQNGMIITLGGIAKGYAIDKAIDKIKQKGIEHALVNAGGDLKAVGKKNKVDNWEIALQNPRNKDEYIAVIPIDNKSIATSGDYERYFDENKTFHHIINPKTGYSPTDLISVTIIADSAMDATVVAKIVYILGPVEGLNWLTRNNYEGLLITKDKKIIKTKGFVW